MKYGHSLPERLQKFNELFFNKQANTITKWDIPTVNGTELYEVYHVSIELPKYRLDNTRTLALQEQYIYNNKLPDDFFNEVESDRVQEIQHGFLKKLIGSSDKDKDLIKYFENQNQTEPLILTHDGFVISGNRRLCAFRVLLEGNYEKYRRFSHIRVVVLPSLDGDKIDQIEDFLEQQKDIKEPFSWVSRALGYRRRMQRYNFSDEQLTDITKQKKGEIIGLINKLEVADRYLEFIGCPKDYNQIIDDFYAFEKIYTCQQKDKAGSIAKKTTFEKLAFLAIKNKGAFSDRMYKNIPIMYEAQSLIQNDIASEFEEEFKQFDSTEKLKSPLTGLNLFPDPAVSINKLVEKPEHEEKVIEIITDRIEGYLALEREKKKKSSVLERVRKANTLLVEANAIKNGEIDTKGVLSQITNIERELNKLKEWADNK
ncbi:hypothetical protein DVR12_27400 [Chitinophaga silvatica]|uniref:ParB/Sulfiredoxin domain-containing protein n=1 Tax=Chitinophaga silvatica TaxID=2282649 RepID=A0A3E1Y202_9BACT|nr:hypothetical protein [Chitinophaga silvatica]RFS18673.1 hypothetical protein DVR12_27400 [Chitinophaga silvatica]